MKNKDINSINMHDKSKVCSGTASVNPFDQPTWHKWNRTLPLREQLGLLISTKSVHGSTANCPDEISLLTEIFVRLAELEKKVTQLETAHATASAEAVRKRILTLDAQAEAARKSETTEVRCTICASTELVDIEAPIIMEWPHKKTVICGHCVGTIVSVLDCRKPSISVKMNEPGPARDRDFTRLNEALHKSGLLNRTVQVAGAIVDYYSMKITMPLELK